PVGISINDVSKNEGDSGTTQFVFTVSLSQATLGPVTVSYATAPDTASANSHYTSVLGQLSFAPGETTKTVTVSVTGDTTVEPDETFFVNLTGAIGANIADNQGKGTIFNDDSVVVTPGITISDVSKAEGNSGTTPFVFDVLLSSPAAGNVTVNYATANGTATAGSDYTSASSTLTFLAGETSKQITVNVSGDTAVEPDETFFVNLSGATGAN